MIEEYPLVMCPCDGEIIGVKSTDWATLYTVRVTLPGGVETVVTNAVQSTVFGGVANNIKFIHDVTEDPKYVTGSLQHQTKGDRVIISFLGGDLRRPVITGSLPHPLQQEAFTGTKPQLEFSFNGFSVEVDPEGTITVSHTGTPTISDLGLVTPGETNSFLEINKGGWTWYDNKNQVVSIDTENNQISFSNKGCEVVLSGEKEMNVTCKGDVSVQADGTVTVESKKDIVIDGSGAEIVAHKGKFSIGNGSEELLDLLYTFLDTMSKPDIINHFIDHPYGPGFMAPPVVKAFTTFALKLKKLMR